MNLKCKCKVKDKDMANFKQMSTQQKQQYAKKFTPSERNSYRKGKRNGWLTHYHATKNWYKKSLPKALDFEQRKYTKAEHDALFDKLREVKI